MVDIPVELFFGFIGMSVVLLIIGLIREPKIPATVVFAGMFMLTITMVTDNIIMGFATDGGTETIQHYDQEGFTGVSDIFGNGGIGGNDIRGEYVFSTSSLLYGDTIDCIELTLRKSGSPTGLAQIGVYDHASATNNPVILVFGDIDVSTLNTGFSQWYTFCLPLGTTYTIGDQDVLGIRYDGGDATNFIRTNVVTVDAFDGTNTRYTSKSDATNTWTDTTTSDLTAIFSLRGQEMEIIDHNFEFTELPKTIFAFFSVILMLLGVLLTKMGM
jgi:hypothetical protein